MARIGFNCACGDLSDLIEKCVRIKLEIVKTIMTII